MRHLPIPLADLVKDNSSTPSYRQSCAEACDGLGDLLAELGRPADAERAYRQAHAERTVLTQLFPRDARYQQQLAECSNALAKLLADGPDPQVRKPAAGVELAQEAVKLAPKAD